MNPPQQCQTVPFPAPTPHHHVPCSVVCTECRFLCLITLLHSSSTKPTPASPWPSLAVQPAWCGQNMNSRLLSDSAYLSNPSVVKSHAEANAHPSQGKRVFIKDITYYLVPPEKQPSRVAPSLQSLKRGVGTNGPETEAAGTPATLTPRDSGVALNGTDSPPKSPPFPYETTAEPNNPTVVPRDILERFHFTFLIRHPKFAIPSYYRCCIPPLVERTGFNPFMPCEAGYEELRALFDYCKDTGMIGPDVCGQSDGKSAVPSNGNIEICVIDADDLLDDPEGILRKYCSSIGVDFRQEMLQWDSEEAHAVARAAFEKWDGFHDDAIGSKDLKPRQHVSLEEMSSTV